MFLIFIFEIHSRFSFHFSNSNSIKVYLRNLTIIMTGRKLSIWNYRIYYKNFILTGCSGSHHRCHCNHKHHGPCAVRPIYPPVYQPPAHPVHPPVYPMYPSNRNQVCPPVLPPLIIPPINLFAQPFSIFNTSNNRGCGRRW